MWATNFSRTNKWFWRSASRKAPKDRPILVRRPWADQGVTAEQLTRGGLIERRVADRHGHHRFTPGFRICY